QSAAGSGHPGMIVPAAAASWPGRDAPLRGGRKVLDGYCARPHLDRNRSQPSGDDPHLVTISPWPLAATALILPAPPPATKGTYAPIRQGSRVSRPAGGHPLCQRGARPDLGWRRPWTLVGAQRRLAR